MFTAIFAFDALWQKAQNLSDNNPNFQPGKTTMSVITTSPDLPDSTFMQNTTIFIQYVGEDGKLATEIISQEMFVNVEGEDIDVDLFDDYDETEEISDEEMEALLKEEGVDSSSRGFEAGFSMEESKILSERNPRNITVRNLNETKEINGKIAQGYSIRYTPTRRRRDRIEGTFWLDVNNGAPVMSELYPGMKIPFVKSYFFVGYYTFIEDSNHFYVDRMIGELNMSILTKKMTMLIDSIFEEHFIYDN